MRNQSASVYPDGSDPSVSVPGRIHQVILFILLLIISQLAWAKSELQPPYALALVSERTAPLLAGATHQFLTTHPGFDIQIRTSRQLEQMTDAELLALLQPAQQILIGGVFGPSVERLLALPLPADQKRSIFHSDRRLQALHRDADGGQMPALSDAQRANLFARPPADQPFAPWLQAQQQAFPQFKTWLANRAYWQFRDHDNLQRLWQALLLNTPAPAAQPSAPVRISENGQRLTADALAALPDLPTLFLLDGNQGDHPQNRALHAAICDQAQGIRCLSVAAAWGDGSRLAVEHIGQVAPKTAPWAILALQDFVIGGGEHREAVIHLFKQLNVPVYKGLRIAELDLPRFRLSATGLPTDSVHYRLAMPELQGTGQPHVLAVAATHTRDPQTGVTLSRLQPLDSEIEHLVNRIRNGFALHTTPNADKRVAIIYYNHPPGRHNIGADNLNVPRSLLQMLQALKAAGYTTGPLPDSPEALLDQLQTRGVNLPEDRSALAAMAGLVNSVSADDYRQWFTTLPDGIQQEMRFGPLAYLHHQLRPLLSPEAPPLASDLAPVAAARSARVLEDLRHILDGTRHPGRVRGLDLLDQLESAYLRLSDPTLAIAARQQLWQQAGDVNQAIIDMGIEGLRGWGEAPGRTMVWQDQLLVPGVQFGNVFLGPQPPRGWELNEELLHANMSFPPPHQYLAYYHWLRDRFQADALVHVGRHSTYEFLPGRATGLTAEDYPALIAGDLPGIYPYIVDGVGEGIQAKRRGRAVMIDHLTPPLATTELYDDLLSLRQLIESAEAAADPDTRHRAVQQLRTQIDQLNLRDELAASMDEELKVRGIGFEQIDDELLLHETGHYLTHLQETFMPLGLHTFGKPWQAEQIDTLLTSMADGKPVPAHWRNALTASPEAEMSALINALEGGYIAPGKGNDPIRTPEALPTGRNFFALDGSLLPTRLGFALGAELADKARTETPEPEGKEAVILWASDAVRDEGSMIAFGLDLLGVRPIWNSRGIINGLELLPLDARRSQRRDVVFTTSGLFRDLYAGQLELLDQAGLMALAASRDVIARDYPALQPALQRALAPLEHAVSTRDEPLSANTVAANWVTETRRLLQANPALDDSDALGRQASLRIFGTAPGSYGAGINRLVERSGSWQDRTQLGQAYIRRMGHAYGSGVHGTSAHDAFNRQLGQIRHTYLGRASHLYGLIDNNDAFDYLGGLNLAVETVTGTAPESFAIDHSRREQAKLTPLAQALGQELRSRYLNPQWLKPLMAEGYAGARTMGSEFMEYLWGWQATSPQLIQSWMWDEVKAVYLDDRLQLGLDEFLQQGHNQQVRSNMMAILLVAAQKGFWETDASTLEQLSQDFADNIIRHGLPGSGHTHPAHPVYAFVNARITADQAKALQQILDAARQPTPASTTPAVTRIQEISPAQQVTPAQPPEDSITSEQADADTREHHTSDLSRPWMLAAALMLLLLAAGALKGRFGGKH
ncbi:cobaltochelatase subunit CobN [Marinobacterium weihaiense]|uniref:Cobaltochelatase subunit CobN n=1 Tax=Marinobacterium weihaiense TaxID=2851016 RepID=A0ABS6MEU7_9GAMM|nr:cobaltochelatase subunit CobN [Marinobacterium weihaiense]MBV0934835.1 cobaltochelatase subunit CobN [Marinobacterium weihaiense]